MTNDGKQAWIEALAEAMLNAYEQDNPADDHETGIAGIARCTAWWAEQLLTQAKQHAPCCTACGHPPDLGDLPTPWREAIPPREETT